MNGTIDFLELMDIFHGKEENCHGFSLPSAEKCTALSEFLETVNQNYHSPSSLQCKYDMMGNTIFTVWVPLDTKEGKYEIGIDVSAPVPRGLIKETPRYTEGHPFVHDGNITFFRRIITLLKGAI